MSDLVWMGLVAFIGYCVGHCRVARFMKSFPPGETLPCPAYPCRNRLPRRGVWSDELEDWAVEQCPVCDASIQYVSKFEEDCTRLHDEDCYVRVAVGEKS